MPDYIAKMEKLDPPRWVFYDDAGKLKLKRRRAAALRAGKKSLSQEQAEVYMQEHLLKDPSLRVTWYENCK